MQRLNATQRPLACEPVRGRAHHGPATRSARWLATPRAAPAITAHELSGITAPCAGPDAPGWDAFAGSAFEALRHERAEDELTVDVDTLLTLYSTTSSLAQLPPDERAALFARARPHLAGPYRLPLKHELTWTRLAR